MDENFPSLWKELQFRAEKAGRTCNRTNAENLPQRHNIKTVKTVTSKETPLAYHPVFLLVDTIQESGRKYSKY